MIVKVELSNRKDGRMSKRVTISTLTDILVQDQDASKDIVKKMDGAKVSYFLAFTKPDPKDPTKQIIELDARVKPQGW